MSCSRGEFRRFYFSSWARFLPTLLVEENGPAKILHAFPLGLAARKEMLARFLGTLLVLLLLSEVGHGPFPHFWVGALSLVMQAAGLCKLPLSVADAPLAYSIILVRLPMARSLQSFPSLHCQGPPPAA